MPKRPRRDGRAVPYWPGTRALGTSGARHRDELGGLDRCRACFFSAVKPTFYRIPTATSPPCGMPAPGASALALRARSDAPGDNLQYQIRRPRDSPAIQELLRIFKPRRRTTVHNSAGAVERASMEDKSHRGTLTAAFVACSSSQRYAIPRWRPSSGLSSAACFLSCSARCSWESVRLP